MIHLLSFIAVIVKHLQQGGHVVIMCSLSKMVHSEML